VSTLVYDTLETELVQEIVIGNHLGVQSPMISPMLFFLNNPAGTFTLGIYKGATLLIEKSFTVADLKTQLNTTDMSGYLYYHVIFGGVNLPFGFYNLKLTSSGYTFSTSSLLAWCKDWESNFNATVEITPIEFTQYPLAVRILSLVSREV
jgi:hypothetical protein